MTEPVECLLLGFDELKCRYFSNCELMDETIRIEGLLMKNNDCVNQAC